ncbi:MAG: hypothetical protein ABI855_08635 [Bacteroidota bacterium]
MKFTFFKKRKPKPKPKIELLHCGFGREQKISKEQLLEWGFVRSEYKKLIESEMEKKRKEN